MLVDIVNPGWAAVCQGNLADDVPGYIAAADYALTYPWKHFISGHMNRLGTRHDVATHRQYMADIAHGSRTTLDSVDPRPTGQFIGGHDQGYGVERVLEAISSLSRPGCSGSPRRNRAVSGQGEGLFLDRRAPTATIPRGKLWLDGHESAAD
jgi:hypothetical protein